MTVGCFLSLPEVMAASWHCSVGVSYFWTKVFWSEIDKVEIPRWLEGMSNEWKDIFTGRLYVSCDSWQDLTVTNIVDEEKADSPKKGVSWRGERVKALLLLNPVNGEPDTKLRAMKGSRDLALMSKHRNVSSLQELVIGSDVLTFLPMFLETGVSGSIRGQKMTPALGEYVRSIILGVQYAHGLGIGRVFLINGQLPWPRATRLWPVCPSGHQEGSHGGWREVEQCHVLQFSTLVCPVPPLFYSSHTPPLNFSSAPHPQPSPQHKRSDWPPKGRTAWYIKWWHFVTDWSGLQQSACQWALHFFPQANVTLKLNRIFFHPTCCFLCHILFYSWK